MLIKVKVFCRLLPTIKPSGTGATVIGLVPNRPKSFNFSVLLPFLSQAIYHF
jgi:hypothetical protein